MEKKIKPLEGLKVLDLSRLLPGPYCSMILADFGAEILRIEDRRFEEEGPGMPTVMRNKRHMTLNLKHSKGKEIFYTLAKGADVLLEGFRPGVTERLGIGYAQLEKQNPRLIYCSLTGYGQDGPYSGMVGHDINYLSFAGVLGLTGKPDGPPVITGTQIADIAAGGMNAAIGILLAVIMRERTGKGQYIDISMMDGAVAMLPFVANLYWEGGMVPGRGDTMLNGRYPCYNVYQTKDGQFISIGALERRFWVTLCQKLGREDFIPHQFDEGERRAEMFAFFKKTFKQKTREEWMEELKDLDICFGMVLSLPEVFQDSQVRHRRLVSEYFHPAKGKKNILAPPIKMSEVSWEVQVLPASFGEHTEQVLKELGMGRKEIESLRKEGVI
jgi:crotonobetainyl-CoA:carnitine CoA-transferase CaiB-like acyl-CoA transferase